MPKQSDYGWGYIEYGKTSRNGCGGCIHYISDGSCQKRPQVLLREQGLGFWKKCSEYTPRKPLIDQAKAVKECPDCKLICGCYRCQNQDSPSYSLDCHGCVVYGFAHNEASKKIYSSVHRSSPKERSGSSIKNDTILPKCSTLNTNQITNKKHLAFELTSPKENIISQDIEKLTTTIEKLRHENVSLKENYEEQIRQQQEQINTLQDTIQEMTKKTHAIIEERNQLFNQVEKLKLELKQFKEYGFLQLLRVAFSKSLRKKD